MDRSDSMHELYIKYLNNQCSPEEVKEFLAYFNDPENEAQLRRFITETLETSEVDDDGSQWRTTTDESLNIVKMDIAAGKSNVVSIYKKIWIRIAVAAVLIVGVFTSYNLLNGRSEKQVIVNTKPNSKDPGSNKAVLTLADGSAVVLQALSDGTIAEQGSIRILKSRDGELTYKTLIEKPTEVLYNSLATPRGGHYRISLGDGSQVWLNAASSLRYPAAFAGNERRVELVGEAYFEVTKNSSMPFRVAISGKGEVEVLGTHFNVNAYDEDSLLTATLMEGSVSIKGEKTKNTKILKPGYQAQVKSDGQMSINEKADLEQALAWKNGTFHFDNADITQVMRQVSRWYDVDVRFEGKIPERRFNGEIQRDLKLEQVLKLLEKNGVYSTLNGKILTVKK